jgi:1-acyl-sn-glycerol-3-phosphate acyltransferase
MLDQGKGSFGVSLLRGTLLLLMRILFRIEHHGMEKVPKDGPLIIASNHVTYFDPFWVAVRIYRKVRFMAWDKIFHVPLAGSLFRWLGAFPVSLDNPEVSAYRKALKILQQGEAVMIFPEGGRSPDGSLLPFKDGAARLALRSGAAILPVVIHGGERVWGSTMLLPLPRKVRVDYLNPIFCRHAEFSQESLTQQVRKTILAHQEQTKSP